MTRATASFVTLFLIFSLSIRGSRITGDAHLIVTICFVNAAFHARSREPCRNRRDERFHRVQQEKQTKVTLKPEESVGGSRKERNALLREFGLRFDPAPVWPKGQLHQRQHLPIPAIVSEMVELGLWEHDPKSIPPKSWTASLRVMHSANFLGTPPVSFRCFMPHWANHSRRVTTRRYGVC